MCHTMASIGFGKIGLSVAEGVLIGWFRTSADWVRFVRRHIPNFHKFDYALFGSRRGAHGTRINQQVTHTNDAINQFVRDGQPTLADVIALISSDASLSKSKRTRAIRDIETACCWFGMAPAYVIAHPMNIRPRFMRTVSRRSRCSRATDERRGFGPVVSSARKSECCPFIS
jgi:hypothetical protein